MKDHEGEDHVTGSVARTLGGHGYLGDTGVKESSRLTTGITDACAVGVVVTGEEGGAASMTRGEVGETIGSTHGLDVVHVALASKVAAVGQVDLEPLRGVLRVGLGGPCHGDVVAAQEEEKTVAAQTKDIADKDELNRSSWTQLEFLENVATKDDADTSSRNCCAAS